MEITFYRSGSAHLAINITDNSYVTRNVMGDDTAFVEIVSAVPISLLPGDYTLLCGHTYYVKDIIIPVRDVTRLKYQLTLYGTIHELDKAKYFIFDSTTQSTTAATSYSCTPFEFLTQLVANMKRIQPTVNWTVGVYKSSEPKTIELSNNNCLELLQSAAELFETDYYVHEFQVSLNKTPRYLTYQTFAVGKGLGLRDITVNKSGDSTMITRLYAYGSETNMPSGQRLTIPYIDAVGASDIVEDIKIFDDIYPRIECVVTRLIPNSLTIVQTNDVGFLMSDYLIPGSTPMITFLSGELNGLEFRCEQFSGTDFLLYPITLPGSVTAPGSPGYNFAVGDKFVIWNITIPELYIEDARTRLYNAAAAWLATASKQKIKLNIVTDDIYFSKNNKSIVLGETLNLVSSIIPQLQGGLIINVIGYKQYISRPWKYESVVVGDVYFSRPLSNKVITIVKNNNSFKSGGADSYYKHFQTEASSEWIVNHNLDKRPSVTVTDTNGKEREGVVAYITQKQLRINFSIPITGRAECN